MPQLSPDTSVQDIYHTACHIPFTFTVLSFPPTSSPLGTFTMVSMDFPAAISTMSSIDGGNRRDILMMSGGMDRWWSYRALRRPQGRPCRGSSGVEGSAPVDDGDGGGSRAVDGDGGGNGGLRHGHNGREQRDSERRG
ncbi:hypothetical protein EYZ11_007600 [Aspergillus tanneri]|nr:hypothetical protein EYZ11_007600 [Aspergillus tanneri]